MGTKENEYEPSFECHDVPSTSCTPRVEQECETVFVDNCQCLVRSARLYHGLNVVLSVSQSVMLCMWISAGMCPTTNAERFPRQAVSLTMSSSATLCMWTVAGMSPGSSATTSRTL